MTGFNVQAEGTDENKEAQTHYRDANENNVHIHSHKEHQAYYHKQDPQRNLASVLEGHVVSSGYTITSRHVVF